MSVGKITNVFVKQEFSQDWDNNNGRRKSTAFNVLVKTTFIHSSTQFNFLIKILFLFYLYTQFMAQFIFIILVLHQFHQPTLNIFLYFIFKYLLRKTNFIIFESLRKYVKVFYFVSHNYNKKITIHLKYNTNLMIK